MSPIWEACRERVAPAPLEGTIYRLVESQEQVATNALVATFAEQALLEDLLERSKPPLPQGSSRLHYLLATPFRYPPLAWGSRFGTRFEPSLFYGSRSRDTVLAESAYYRFVFWSGMSVPPPEPLETQHTLFGASIGTTRALQLQAPPFDEYAAILTDRQTYAATQALGAAMREAGIDAFEYRSARDPRGGINVALYTPAAFAASEPNGLHEWLCETSAATVRFYSRHGGGLVEHPLATFLVAGKLPAPPH